MGRSIYNIVGGILTESNCEHCLLESCILPDGKAETIARCLTRVVNSILDPYDSKNYLCLVVTDGAANMVATGKFLKLLYSGLRQITCVVHKVSLICNKLFNKTPNYNYFIHCFQGIFCHSNRRKKQFKEFKKLTLPNFGVDTKWGTKLQFGLFVIDSSQIILEYLEEFKGEIPIASDVIKIMLHDEFSKELYYLESFKEIPKFIIYLESENLVVFEVFQKIKQFKGVIKNDVDLFNDWTNWEKKEP